MYIILENLEIAKSFDPETSLLLSSVDIERLESIIDYGWYAANHCYKSLLD